VMGGDNSIARSFRKAPNRSDTVSYFASVSDTTVSIATLRIELRLSRGFERVTVTLCGHNVTIWWLADMALPQTSASRGAAANRSCRVGLPQSQVRELHGCNGTAKASVRTIKRDSVRISPCPDANTTVTPQLSAWINHYNEVYPHEALGYRSPRDFIAAQLVTVSGRARTTTVIAGIASSVV
jgi:transposase InsO family protein